MVEKERTYTLKGHVQILNPLLDKGFSSILAGKLEPIFTRSNYPPELVDFLIFFKMQLKQKGPAISVFAGLLSVLRQFEKPN